MNELTIPQAIKNGYILFSQYEIENKGKLTRN